MTTGPWICDFNDQSPLLLCPTLTTPSWYSSPWQLTRDIVLYDNFLWIMCTMTTTLLISQTMSIRPLTCVAHYDTPPPPSCPMTTSPCYPVPGNLPLISRPFTTRPRPRKFRPTGYPVDIFHPINVIFLLLQYVGSIGWNLPLKKVHRKRSFWKDTK